MNPAMFKQMPFSFFDHFNQQEVPARVRAAMTFLSELGTRSLPRAAVNDMSIELLNPPELSISELDARSKAANLLADYFDGSLEPSIWEDEKETSKSPTGLPGLYSRCPFCAQTSKASPGCPCCKGSGEVMIYPVMKTEE